MKRISSFKSNLNYFRSFPEIYWNLPPKKKSEKIQRLNPDRPQVATEFCVWCVASDNPWLTAQESRWVWEWEAIQGELFFCMQGRLKIFLKSSSFPFWEESGKRGMWKAMDCCAKRLLVVTKVGQIFVYQAFYKEQGCKNCASGKTRQQWWRQKLIVLIQIWNHCRSHLQKSLWSRKRWGSLFSTKCKHSDVLVCCWRHIQFSSASLLPCAPDPPLFCFPGMWTWRGGSSLGV